MKKKIIVAISIVFALTIVRIIAFAAYRSSDSYRQKKAANEYTTTIQIGEIIYYNTGEAVPVEPDESVIVDAHPSEGDEIQAYAIINPNDVDEMVVGLIDGEWYKFLPKQRETTKEVQSIGTPAIPEDAVTMQGIVLEINNGRLIIEPVEGSAELKSSDKFSVPIEHMDASPEPQVGYTVEIFYDGSIEETYPAMLGTVYYVRVVVESMTTDCEAVNPDNEKQFKDYTQNSDGTWECEGNTYKYKLEITGRMNNADCDTTFVYLSNIKEITFDQAWKASGLSSDMNDYFDVEDAVLVMWQKE